MKIVEALDGLLYEQKCGQRRLSPSWLVVSHFPNALLVVVIIQSRKSHLPYDLSLGEAYNVAVSKAVSDDQKR